MHTIYARVVIAGAVGGFDWWGKREDRAAAVPSDPQDWADLDVALPSRLDPNVAATAVTAFLDADAQLADMESAGKNGDTSIDFGNR